ncbi:MAG: T9SS type A sorting domain-containing protein [Candidatus Latescibacteria bacterium]|nr:T9SS type A sorting domain-containing protein [Candidatus Latescibacterota bacterium]
MRRITIGALGLLLALPASSSGVSAATFSPLAFPGADRALLDRGASRADLGRDLMGSARSGVILGRVDVYDRFPFLEARYLQVVSDPTWNRLLFGDPAAGLAAYDGAASGFGQLDAPAGLAADDAGRVYVADSGNDRVLVLKATYDSESLSLTPLYAIEGLSRPQDVAWSDGGTPFQPADDRLFVANTGANEIVACAPTAGRFAPAARLGALGGGVGRFAGPTAIAAAWAGDANRVLVADAHAGRIVELSEAANALRWERAVSHGLGRVEGLDLDAWGNCYAAAPGAGVLRKFDRQLRPLGDVEGALRHPHDVCVPAVTVSDHRTGDVSRRREAASLVVEDWSEGSGLRLYALGPDLQSLQAEGGDAPRAEFLLTDRAAVSATILDAAGARIAFKNLNTVDAGPASVSFAADDFLVDHPAGDYRLRIDAASAYPDGPAVRLETGIALAAGQAPARALALMGNFPNPFNPSTTLRFTVPAGSGEPLRLEVFDVRGRLVRVLAEGVFAAGEHSAVWDGRDGEGRPQGSGVYFSRLTQGQAQQQGKLLLLK